MKQLSENQKKALCAIYWDSRKGIEFCSPFGVSGQAAMSLVRAGLVEVIQQSEHVRGESRAYYKLYRTTLKGNKLASVLCTTLHCYSKPQEVATWPVKDQMDMLRMAP